MPQALRRFVTGAASLAHSLYRRWLGSARFGPGRAPGAGLVAAPPPTPPKILVIGEVKMADALWEQHRLQFRNGGFESVLDDLFRRFAETVAETTRKWAHGERIEER